MHFNCLFMQLKYENSGHNPWSYKKTPAEAAFLPPTELQVADEDNDRNWLYHCPLLQPRVSEEVQEPVWQELGVDYCLCVCLFVLFICLFVYLFLIFWFLKFIFPLELTGENGKISRLAWATIMLLQEKKKIGKEGGTLDTVMGHIVPLHERKWGTLEIVEWVTLCHSRKRNFLFFELLEWYANSTPCVPSRTTVSCIVMQNSFQSLTFLFRKFGDGRQCL